MSNGVEAREAGVGEGTEGEGTEGEGTKKRIADRRSPDRSVRDEEPHRRVRRGKESAWAEARGMDDVEAALPETLDLSGRAELSTAAMHELLVAQPRTSILRLDGCVVFSRPVCSALRARLRGAGPRFARPATPHTPAVCGVQGLVQGLVCGLVDILTCHCCTAPNTRTHAHTRARTGGCLLLAGFGR